MYSRVILLTFLILAISGISKANTFKNLERVVAKVHELESSTKDIISIFSRDLLTIYSDILLVRDIVDEGPQETAEVFDRLYSIDTSGVCNSCENFITHLRTFDESKKIEEALEFTIEKLCDPFLNKTVCNDAITSFGTIFFDSLLDRLLNSSHVCQKMHLCPRTKEDDNLKKYVKEVLSDKPAKNIPTPTKKATYKVLQLTDLHIDLKYQPGMDAFCNEPLCCRADNGIPSDPTKGAEYWGTLSGCDIPQRTYDQFLQFIANNFDVDMVLWTGDNISHDVWNQNVENQTVNTYDATQDMLKYLPNTTVYPMFGNHETYPADQYDFIGNNTSWLTSRLADMWNVWLDGEALETFREKSFYSVLNAQHNVKVIALDTVACDSLNFYNIRDPEDPNGQLAWLREELYDAEEKGLAVFIMAHIPPGDFGCDSQWSSRYRALVDRFTNIIRGQFFGHTHADQFEIVRSYADNSPVGVAFIAPSLTSFSYRQPSFRIYEIDAETNQPVNYYQYRLDLDKWNQNLTGPISWDLAYDVISEYSMPDMSNEAFDSLLENIKVDHETAQKYAINFNSGTAADDLSKRVIDNYYCPAKFSVSDDALKCLGFDADFGDFLNFVLQLLPGRWFFGKC